MPPNKYERKGQIKPLQCLYKYTVINNCAFPIYFKIFDFQIKVILDTIKNKKNNNGCVNE